MKKIAFIVSLLCLTLSVAAQSITGMSRIVLVTAGEPNRDVNILISSSFSDAFDNTWDAEVMPVDGINKGVYIYSSGTYYVQWASNGYTANLPIGFRSCGNNDYTLKFENFTGATYKIFDTVADEVIEVNGSTPDYAFSIADGSKNTNINDRFLINVPVDTDPLETCFTGTELQIKSNPYYGKITVKTSGGSTVKQYAYGTSSINFNETDGGGDYIYSNNTEYTVSFGTSRSFIVKVKR
jgi:hypothetical protein